MQAALFGVSVLLSFVVSTILSIRLLRLAAKTRELPETLAGFSFLIAGVIGFLFMVVGSAGEAAGVPVETGLLFFRVGYFSISLGVVLTYAFTWSVFKRSSRVAAGFAGVASIIVLVTGLPAAVPTAVTGQLPTEGWPMILFWSGHAVRIGAGIWGAFEAFRYHGLLLKRQRLGLSDPVVTNRVFLWGCVGVSTALIFAAATIGNVIQTTNVEQAVPMSQVQMSIVALLTVVAAGCQWFALLPPKSYLGWVRSRAQGVA